MKFLTILTLIAFTQLAFADPDVAQPECGQEQVAGGDRVAGGPDQPSGTNTGVQAPTAQGDQ